MATTWNKDPHGADGKLDPQALQDSLKTGTAALLNGSELLLGANQIALADGSHITMYHHVAASAASQHHKTLALKVPSHMQGKHGDIS